MKRRGEEGSGLILALAMLTVIGLLLTAVLGFAFSATNAATTIRGQGKRIYAADAGIERAIQEIRYNSELGRDPDEGGTCPTVTLPGVNGKDVTVTCRGMLDSGSTGGSQQPRNAIMTLSSTETGVYQGSNNTLGVIGNVKSNSSIDTGATTSRLQVDGLIRARGTCSDGVINGTTGDKICNLGVAPPGVVDPLYPPEVTSQPAVPGSIPTCPTLGATWLVQLDPGTYTQSASLEALTRSCGNRVIHFRPGVYYFDFTDDPTWDISSSGVSVVAGTPLGWDPASITRPSVPIPGGCNRDSPGVQFIFSGVSRVHMTNGTIEFCPTPHASAQRISVYQKASTGAAGFARPTGCIVQQPYSGGACALLRAGSPGPRFVSWGTVYAPSAVVDLQVGNSSEQILGRGVISRVLRLQLPASCVCPAGMIQVPISGAANREVEFLATVDGVVRLRAVAIFEDSGGDVPGEFVRITSWSIRR